MIYSFKNLSNFSKSDLNKIERIRKRSSVKVKKNRNIDVDDHPEISDVDLDEMNITAITPKSKQNKFNNNEFVFNDDNIENEILDDIWSETEDKINSE